MTSNVGKVTLVGAGPGAPDLITVRGRELLARADVVVYDSLVSDAFVQWAPNAENVFVGKRKGRHSLPQEDINRILIEHARRGLNVVRLKGGDPFIFGRGGEEVAALADAGVPFEVVPGVTAATGAAAYAGIPITLRSISSSVTFLSGHDVGQGFGRLHLEGTLCFYMALSQIKPTMEELIRSGRPSKTSVALVQHATLGTQRTIVGTLETISSLAQESNVETPAMIIVGDVVQSRTKLSWFEQRPLYGRRIVVPKTVSRIDECTRRLRDLGAEVMDVPVVDIDVDQSAPVPDMGEFDWIVFTSRNAVESVVDMMAEHGLDARALAGVKIAVAGEKTLASLTHRFLKADAAQKGYDPALLIGTMEEAGTLNGQRVLVPRADVARSALPDALRQRGAHVEELQAYRTELPSDAGEWADDVLTFAPHYIALSSAAATRNFCAMLGKERLLRLVESAAFATVGPNTNEAAQEEGVSPKIASPTRRIPGMVDAIVEWDRNTPR